MPNHIPEQHGRTSGVRLRKPTFVIATEGEKTEPDYFAYLDRIHHDINIIPVPANDGHSQPRQVLNNLLHKKQEIENKGLSSYQYWIVFDHDRRPRPELEEVMKEAQANQVFVADSNPCFEAWLIQHFSSLTDIVELSHVRPVKSCAYVIENHLKRQDFDPEYRKGSLDSNLYMPKVCTAIQNAEFDEETARHSDEFNCTGSRVHKLVKRIRSGD